MHRNVVTAITARGEDPNDRETYITEAAKQASRHDPMSRPLEESEKTAWAVRRARDNAQAELAMQLLRSQGKSTHTAEEFHAAMNEVAERTGTSYRDDVPGWEKP